MAKERKPRRRVRTRAKGPIKSVYGTDFRYSVDYESESGTSCDGTCGDYMCHHGTITVTGIRQVVVSSLVSTMGYSQTQETGFWVDRIMTALEVWQPDVWNVHIGHGYYGQEVQGITMDRELACRCDSQIAKVAALKTLTAKVRLILKLEYGYLLPVIAKESWIRKSVPFKSLVFGQDEHYRRLSPRIREMYQNYPAKWPVAFCVTSPDGKFRIIDGYHRSSVCEGRTAIPIITTRRTIDPIVQVLEQESTT